MINVENFQEDWGEDEEESGDHDDSESVEELNEMIVEEIDSDDGDGDDESSDGDGMDNYLGESEESEDDNNNDDEEVGDEIGETFIRTFSNGNYDVEFNEALNFDRGLIEILPSMPTHASYNKPDNWVDRNRIGLEIVKEQLLTCIDLVSDQSFCLKLRHNEGWDYELLIDNEEPIVWHEPILDMYWNKLEANIDRVRQLVRITKVEGIHFANVEMKKEHLAALVAIFSSGRATNSSTTVEFDNANLCADGIISLSDLLDISSKLQTVRLYHNRIDNMESARCLARSLKSHACIKYHHLTHCDLGSHPEILLVILQSDVEYINLDSNNIDSLGAIKIAEYLEGDPPGLNGLVDNRYLTPPIQRIDFDHNRLNDDDAILISQAMKRNTNLKTINMQSNNISSIGVKALLTCVFDSSSLNALSESNHRLKQIIMFYNDINETNDGLQDCIDRMLELDRTDKILLALQDKDSLLKYLTKYPWNSCRRCWDSLNGLSINLSTNI